MLESRPPGALTAAEIRALLAADPPLAMDLADIELQVQPNGLDVRLESVWTTAGPGRLGQREREAAPRRELEFDERGWVHLPPGGHVVRLCETLSLPLDLMALGFARSSLLRSGCGVLNAVWDAGYHGRSEALLLVANPTGFWVERGARVLQIVFFRLPRTTQAYAGAYQGENPGGGRGT